MIDDKGQILGASDKIHLTPFGEYVPFEDILRRFGIEELISLPGGFTAAASRAPLKLPSGIGFYPLICYEAIFPAEIAPDLAGANAILNVTNDAWFGSTPGPYQHFLQARLRAVETGLPLIRVANNGISAVVDPYGRVIDGLALNASGATDATLDVNSDPERNIQSQLLNFWLVIAAMTAIALFSRLGFIRRMN